MGNDLPQIIDMDYAPGSVRISKKVYRLVDLSANGTEISLGGAGEMWLYSDQPINLKIGESPTNITKVGQLHLTGYLSKLTVYRPTLYAGRLVLYLGFPSLGVNFKREDHHNRSRFVTKQTALAWPALATYVDLSAVTIPATMVNETFFLWAISLERSNNKTIDNIEFIESETGFSYPLWTHKTGMAVPYHKVMIRLDVPARISCSGAFRIYGASDAAAQTLDSALEISYL